MLGRMVVTKRRRIFEDGGRDANMFLMCTMMWSLPSQMKKWQAGALCVGGPCKYVLKEGSGVTDNFLLENVVRSTRTRYSDDVAKVLGKALLWSIFSPDGDYLPQALQDRVNTTIMLYYLLVRTL